VGTTTGRSEPGRIQIDDATASVATVYFVAQAIVGVLLWVGYASSPQMRSWFGLAARPAVTTAFAWPDLAVIVVASLASAATIASRSRWAVPSTALTAGAVLYPTVYLLGWVATTTGSGGATLAIMIPPSVLTCWFAYRLMR
jgi:hypothetical protein